MDSCEIMKIETEAMKNRTGQYIKHIEKLNEYVDDLRKRNEEEITVRKQFEAKLNELHSIGRDQEIRYYRAIEDIDKYMQRSEFLEKESEELKAENIELHKAKINLETEFSSLETKYKSINKDLASANRLLGHKEKRIYELEIENSKVKNEKSELNKQSNGLSLRLNISEQKCEKYCQDIETLESKLSKMITSNKSLESKVANLTTSNEKAIKDCKKSERELKSIQEKDNAIVATNTTLQTDLNSLKSTYDKLLEEHQNLQAKEKEFNITYSDLKMNYESCHSSLFKVNEERRKLFEDACRSERMLKNYEKELEELKKVYELEKLNYDKISMRFSQIEIEFENSEITKRNEMQKLEIENEMLEQKLRSIDDVLKHCEEQRIGWIKRYEDECANHLQTICQFNNLKVEMEDVKVQKEKLESDIRELDKSNRQQLEVATEKTKEYEELVQINEKLKVQLEGSKEAFINIEHHHKDYIIKMKREHRKTMTSIDNIYNMVGMEYEDLYVKTHKLYTENLDNMTIIRNLKEQSKGYKDQARKFKDSLAEQNSKLEVSKKFIEEFRKENITLEENLEKKKKEFEDLNMKIKILIQDKDSMRKDFLERIQKVEIVVESVQTESKDQESTESEKSNTSDEEVETLENNEKKCQTLTCFKKSKAVQTNESMLKASNKINCNRSDKAGGRAVSSSKTINSQASNQNLLSNNLDLIQAENYYIPEEKYSDNISNRNRTRNRKYTIEELDDDTRKEYTPNVNRDSMFPNLKRPARNSSYFKATTFLSPTPKASEKSLLNMNPKHLAHVELSEGKDLKLKAIYNEVKKSGFANKKNLKEYASGMPKITQIKSSTVLKKGGLKDIIKNATARG